MNSENTHGLSLKEILVVEDNPSDLKFMLDILTQAGYRVRPACDGELALRSVLAKHPDLILLDVKLPGIMGVEICRLLKSDPETKNIPVIFLSALGESELKVKALEAGGTDYITKPFESSEVLARIKVHLDLHRLQMDLAIKSEKLTEKIKEHRESEEALRISEEKFRTAFDAASDCIIIWDREYNYIYVNQSAMDYVGITSDQVIGKNIRDGQSHMPEFMRLWMSRVDLVVASGEELRVQDRTLIGERLFFTDSILSPLFASDGRVEAVYVAYRDITELKNAESSLRLMDFAFKSSLSANSLANTDGVLIHANPSFAKIWGYENEAEVIGKPINYFLADEAKALEIIEAIQTTGKWEGEYKAVRKDGSTFRAQSSANSVHDTEGNTVALYSSVIDVTEIRNSEKMLLESYEMISSTPAVAFRWRNAEGWPVEYVSDNVKGLLGYTAEEFLSGKVAYSEIIHPEDLEVFGIEVAKYSSDKKARGFSHDPYRVITKDGETKWIADRTNFRRDENGEITHFRGIVLDITEQRNIQEERKRLENSLYQSDKMASIGQLSAGVAHEINNPIGFISSNLNTMKEYLQELTELFNGNELESSENREQIDELIIDFGEAISESQEGAERVKNIVADMKGFSRADSVEMEATNLNDGLTSTLNIVWNQLKYNCKVEKELGDIPEVECFPSKINQVFLNLLVNAGHAIEGDSGLITIKTWAADGNVHVSIRDNGCGIPKENLPKLFDAFFTTKEVGKGTGLGLNLSHDIISNHGGTISVTSELGKGTEFEVALPFEEIREPILIPLD